MTLTETTDIAECGGISIALAILPTVGLFISEILPYLHKTDKCNGILQTITCMIKRIIYKEPCSAEEVTDALTNIIVAKTEEGRIEGEEDTT
tara:strand:- start:7633 stop:7908 length:276 start_codon:yes stop_codon:yes gene_type:complete